MYLKCKKHGVFDSDKSSQKCKICKQDLKYFCVHCEKWLYCTYETKHKQIKAHQQSESKKKKPEHITLFTFFEDQTYSALIPETERISSLKNHMSQCLDRQLNPGSFIITTKQVICHDEMELSVYFGDKDFFCINEVPAEKGWFEKTIEDVESLFLNLSLDITKHEDLVPLLSKEKKE